MFLKSKAAAVLAELMKSFEGAFPETEVSGLHITRVDQWVRSMRKKYIAAKKGSYRDY